MDLLYLGDGSLDTPMMFADFAHPFCMIDTRQHLLDTLFTGYCAGCFLSLNVWNALRLSEYSADVLHSHICECYPSLEPTCINGFLLPRRYLSFVYLQSRLNGTDRLIIRHSLAWSLLNYCNLQRAPTELRIDVHDFKSSVSWMEFGKYMMNIKNHAHAYSGSNPKICLVVPFIQEFFSSVEVLELGSYYYTIQYQPRRLEEDMHIVSYVLLYNILTSRQPHLKHFKLFGVPDSIERVMSTVVELLNVTCTTPSKSKFCLYTGLEPLSLPTTPYLLEGISILPYEEYQIDNDYEFTTASCASSISRDLISILQIHMLKLKSMAVNSLGYCCDLDHMIIVDGQVSSGKTNVNVPDYRKLLTLLVEFIKQPQFTELTVIKSPLPEGFELILAFLCTPASHEQSLTIEASSQRSVEEAEDDDDEEEEDEENWIVNEYTIEEQKKGTFETPPSKKCKFNSPLKPPCFPSQPLPLTNPQYKCLDLGQSSDCVYSWLFNQLPELKLKSLKMKTLDMTIVPADMVILVEHIAFTLDYCHRTADRPIISSAHLEKFVIANPAIKLLEFKNDWDMENVTSVLPALNHCLLKLDQQGRGLEELILTFVQLDKFDKSQLRELFVRVRDFSHRYGTVLVLSTYMFRDIAESDFFLDLSKEFEENKIGKIICYSPDDCDPSLQLGLIAKIVTLNCCKPPHAYY